jgi:hypothetical protein
VPRNVRAYDETQASGRRLLFVPPAFSYELLPPLCVGLSLQLNVSAQLSRLLLCERLLSSLMTLRDGRTFLPSPLSVRWRDVQLASKQRAQVWTLPVQGW